MSVGHWCREIKKKKKQLMQKNQVANPTDRAMSEW